MKTRQLIHLMNSYTSSTLSTSIEDASLTHEPVVEDEEYSPNSAIVEELIEEANPPAPITNYDTAVKLLSDSVEAARRLDIVRMNMNYPVSGHARISNATLLKADPGLECMVHDVNFSRRQLTQAIEAKQSALMKVALTVVVGLLAGVIHVVSVLLFRRVKHKRNGIDDITFKNIFKSAHSNDKLKWSLVEPDLKAQAPSKYITASMDKKITLGEYIQAIFVESVWPNIDNFARVMVNQPEFLDRTMTNIDKMGKLMKPFTQEVSTLIKQVATSVKNKQVMPDSGLLEKHKEVFAVVADIKETANMVSAATGTAKSLKDCLKPMEAAMQVATKVNYSQYVDANDEVKRLSATINDLTQTLNNAVLEDDVYSSINREIEVIKKTILDLATVYTNIGRIEAGFTSLENQIQYLDSSFKGVI